MIDRLRLTIKLDEGKQPSNFTKCDILKLTSNIIEDLKISYPNREINLISDNIKIKVDETMFGIAITNLIENALKYSLDDILVELTDEKINVSPTIILRTRKKTLSFFLFLCIFFLYN